jgi:GNAT superfamily N-acetyltransferase
MIISISAANVDDAENLTAIQKQAFERLYVLYQDEANPYLRGSDEIVYHIENNTMDIYKIVADGSLCGGISIRNDGNGEYYLHRIYVQPQLQSNGIAKKAIELCEMNYPTAKKWKVDFPIDQIANKKCYENSGYNDTGVRKTISDKLILAFYEKML